MDQIIRIKRSYIRGSVPASLEEGEIAINIADKYIYASDESGIIRLYSNATQTNDGLLSSVDKTKLDKIITSGNGDSFLSNSGEYKSIVSSLILDYAEDLKNFSGIVEENVIQNIQEAIEGKIPIYISLNGTIQYLAFAAENDSEIVLSIDSVSSENIISILATINISTRNITSTVNSQSIYHPIILLNYTDDLKKGNLGESVSQEVSQKLLDAINGGWACVVKSGNSDILCNLQKVGDVVTIIMESITKIDTEYFAATTIIGVNTSSNTITYSDSGGLYLVDKDKVLLKDNTTSYTPISDYNPATKKYVDDKINSNSKDNEIIQILNNLFINYDDVKTISQEDYNKLSQYFESEGVVKYIYPTETDNNENISIFQVSYNFLNYILGFKESDGNIQFSLQYTGVAGYNGTSNVMIAINPNLNVTITFDTVLLSTGGISSGEISISAVRLGGDNSNESSMGINLSLGGEGNKFLSDDGKYKEISIPDTGDDILLTGYQRSALENDALQLSETDNVNVAFGKLEKAIIDNEEVTAATLTTLNSSLGFTSNGAFSPSNTNIQGKSVTEALDWICEQINILTQALTLNQV